MVVLSSTSGKDAMKKPLGTDVLRQLLAQLGYFLAAVIGFKYGFDFGNQVAGVPFGVLMALNAAVFGAILFSVFAGLLLRPRNLKRK
jgi:hypothetical protein